MISEHTPTVLSIAGYDPYGGAGIIMDTKTVHALGGYCVSTITAVTAQNATGVKAVEAVSISMLEAQLETLLEDTVIDAVKIGMLANTKTVETVAKILHRYRLSNVILDPVLVSSSGKVLLEPQAVKVMVDKLFPLCRLITPNLPEINALLGSDYQGTPKEVPKMAEALFAIGAKNLLLKGGHTVENEAADYLVETSSITRFATPRIETSHTHGTGCLLSSAIATYLADGLSLAQSIKSAKNFFYKKLKSSSALSLSYKRDTVKRKEPIF
ncbi:Hydroxymethylpyrimidine phosphate kinase ThiD [hydrothermal vent metagenome]|uniref:Hydroxymethylpyrimidine phosphate kinase ThiD n=1 Tax=hydrothermal vent metagenome TaxID=652676 RepID=A0A1W1E7Z5_9ZZZZ